MRLALLAALVVASAACATAPPTPPAPQRPPAPAEPLATLVDKLGAESSETRRGALESLAGLRETPPPDLLARLLEMKAADPSATVRAWATWTHHQLCAGCITNDFEKPPALLHQVMPKYPGTAYKAKIQGVVDLSVLIGEDGSVVHAHVAKSRHPDLDAAAVECVLQWRFEPAWNKDRPVAAVARVPITFRIF